MKKKAAAQPADQSPTVIRTQRLKFKYFTPRINAPEGTERPKYAISRRFMGPKSPASDYPKQKSGTKDDLMRLVSVVERIIGKSLKTAAMRDMQREQRKAKAVRSFCRVNSSRLLKLWRAKGKALCLLSHLNRAEMQTIRRCFWPVLEDIGENVGLTALACRCAQAAPISCISAAIQVINAIPEYRDLLKKRVGTVTPASLLPLYQSTPPNSCFQAISTLFPMLEARPKPESLRCKELILSTCRQCGYMTRSSLWKRWNELGSVPAYREEEGLIVYDGDFYSESLSAQAADMTAEDYISSLQQSFPTQNTGFSDHLESQTIEDFLRYYSRIRRDIEYPYCCSKCQSCKYHIEQHILIPAAYFLLYVPPGLQLTLCEQFYWQNRRYSLLLAVQANEMCEVLQWPQWRSAILNPHCLLFREVQ